jgi:DNA helicase HerA-like ATPase
MVNEKSIGIILTEPTTQKANCQLFEHAEKERIREGMFLEIKGKRKILVRVASIVPQNEFYKSGDAWTESRRQQWSIPDQVARRYTECELELLGELPGLTEVSVPPNVGDLVYEIDMTNSPEEIFGVTKKSPGIIWYGTLVGYQNAQIPLTIEGIPMHVAVFGTTGSGKSYDVGALIEQLVEIYESQNKVLSLPMLIIDSHGDYLDYVNEYEKKGSFGAAPLVCRYVFPNSPEIKIKKPYIRPIAIKINNLTKRDLAEMIVQFYSGGEKNELQISGIVNLFDFMAESHDISEGDYQRIFIDHDMYALALRRLDELGTRGLVHSQTKPAIVRALGKFREIEDTYRLLSTTPQLNFDFIDNLTKNREIAIIDFSADGAPGVPPNLKQLITSYLSAILYSRFTEYKINKRPRYLLFLIEEAHNYCPNLSTYNVGYSLAREKLSIIATQGRKFGLSLCLITQRPSFVDPVVLSMCNTFFIHRVSPDDMGFVKKISGGLPNSLERRLTILEKGELIVTGVMNVRHLPLLIKVIHGVHRHVEATMGSTDLLGDLRRLEKEE